jgi:hypothetical protein
MPRREAGASGAQPPSSFRASHRPRGPLASRSRLKENPLRGPVSFEVITLGDAQRQMAIEVRAAHECAEAATWSTNELVGRTLETAVSGKEAATTLHHAHSVQVHIARVLAWATVPAQAEGEAASNSSPPKLDEWLVWMQRARQHAEKLCGCFPASEKVGDSVPRIAEWAERWPQDYLEAKTGRKSH